METRYNLSPYCLVYLLSIPSASSGLGGGTEGTCLLHHQHQHHLSPHLPVNCLVAHVLVPLLVPACKPDLSATPNDLDL